MYVIDLIENQKIAVQVTKAQNSELRSNNDFEFNWSEEIEYDVYKLETKVSNDVLGLISIKIISEELRIEIRLLEIRKDQIGKNKRYQKIAGILIAFACKKAFDLGFYGFVSLIPKTKLLKHYKDKYGFKQFGRHLAVELEQSEIIMIKYLTNE